MARPKKVVLLVDADLEQLSMRSFLIETTGIYRVIPASSSAEAMEIIDRTAAGTLDLLAAEWPGVDVKSLIIHANAAMPTMPTLLFSNTVGGVETFDADSFIPRCGSVFPALLLERMRLLLVRKRGPKKKPAGSVPAADVDLRKVS